MLSNIYIILFLNIRQFDFVAGNINRFTPRVTRLDKSTWIELRPVKITWDTVQLGHENQSLDIELARFSLTDDGHVFFHSIYTVITDHLNTGEALFTVPRGQAQG